MAMMALVLTGDAALMTMLMLWLVMRLFVQWLLPTLIVMFVAAPAHDVGATVLLMTNGSTNTGGPAPTV